MKELKSREIKKFHQIHTTNDFPNLFVKPLTSYMYCTRGSLCIFLYKSHYKHWVAFSNINHCGLVWPDFHKMRWCIYSSCLLGSSRCLYNGTTFTHNLVCSSSLGGYSTGWMYRHVSTLLLKKLRVISNFVDKNSCGYKLPFLLAEYSGKELLGSRSYVHLELVGTMCTAEVIALVSIPTSKCKDFSTFIFPPTLDTPLFSFIHPSAFISAFNATFDTDTTLNKGNNCTSYKMLEMHLINQMAHKAINNNSLGLVHGLMLPIWIVILQKGAIHWSTIAPTSFFSHEHQNSDGVFPIQSNWYKNVYQSCIFW